MISLPNLLAKSPGGKSHSRVHLVYFVLATFDILAVLAGLLLSNHFASVFERTVEFRQGWDKIFSEMWQLNDLVMDTGAPLIEVFEAGDPVGKSRQFEQNLRTVATTIASLQQEIIASGKAEVGQDVLAALLVAQNTLKITAEHGRLAFSNYYNGSISKAARYMSLTQGSAHELKHQFQGALASILVLTHNHEKDSVNGVRALKRYELLIALFILFMVACVTTYGHYIGKLIKRNHQEITGAYDRLKVSRADTLAFAARLQTVNEDVTRLNQELAANMKQLEQAQDENIRKGKLAQLGQLTATVAHEIRNPLNAIRTAAYLVERKLNAKTPDLEAHFSHINRGVSRCDSIITELLDFTRKRALRVDTVDVDQWLKEVLSEQAQRLPEMVKVEFKPGLQGISARFDSSRMYRVVVNFLSNASEAMVGKGDDPSKFSTPTPRIVISTTMGARGIEIACADNGPGITEENLRKVREPLFTTKSYGVGLGLSAIDNILDQHGGELRIETKLGEGTKMIAWIPTDLGEREAA